LEQLDESKNGNPIKIGGWLILVAIGLILSPFQLLNYLITTYPDIFFDGRWEAATTQGSAMYSPIWGPFIIGEIFANLSMTVISIYLIFLFFTKRTNFPVWYFGLSLFSIIFILLDAYILTLVMPQMEMLGSNTLKELVGSLIPLVIWSPYLIYSKRSRDTFVNLRT
jgi:hypothetical protein